MHCGEYVGKQKSQLTYFQLVDLLISDPGGILTPNRWSRNPVLYTIELRSRFKLSCQIKKEKLMNKALQI